MSGEHTGNYGCWKLPSTFTRREACEAGWSKLGGTHKSKAGRIDRGNAERQSCVTKPQASHQPPPARCRRAHLDCGCLLMTRRRLAGNSAGTSPLSGRFVVGYQLGTIIAAVFRPCNTLFPSFGGKFSSCAKKTPEEGLWPSIRPRTGFAPAEHGHGIARGPCYDRMSPAFKAASSPGQSSAIGRKRSSSRPRRPTVRHAVEYVLSTIP